MFDILKTEFRRFLGWALAYAAVHAMLLMFLTRVLDLAQQPDEVYLAFGAALVLSGLLLGLYQMGGYRRPNAWLNLLHRPLSPWRIALALLGAGAVLLAIGVLVPLLLAAGWQDAMTPRVLDQRHLLLCFSAYLWALAGYLTGAAAVLVPRRASLAPLVFLLLLPAAYAVGAGATVLQSLVLLWLLALVIAAFKPELECMPQGPAGALLAVPMQVLAWLLLVLAGFGVELLWIAEGSHPNNVSQPPVGSAKQADNAEGADLIVAGLATSTDPLAELWREQAAISDISTFGVGVPRTAIWDELTNRAPMSFDDSERRIRWVFSHDQGKLVGQHIGDNSSAGILGVEGHGRFRDPPLPGPGGLLVSRQDVYQFERDTQRVLPRVSVPANEVIAGVSLSGERLAVMTQLALYSYDARPLRLDEGRLQTRLRVPLPGPVGDLQRIDVMELFDGLLVSFTFGRYRHNGLGSSYQQLLRVDETGNVDSVAFRELASGYGPLYTWQTWWLSPAISEGLGAARHAFAPTQPGYLLSPPPKPPIVVVVALGLMLFSLLVSAWRVQRTALSMRGRIVWCLACGVVGLPALLSLWRLVRLRELPEATDAKVDSGVLRTAGAIP